MTYRPTILNVSTGIFIVSCVVYAVVNYPILSANEGWGVVVMVGLTASALIPLLIDLLLQVFIKDKRAVNITGLVVVIIFALLYVTA
ncbi:MAG TPA: hypothetical protein PLZ45_09985 [Ferruginibacter sp.]|nr:hypothetical protein [Chitinophagaceae bacterium]HRI24998.1 hypothetical protein [Ferruginibacter sp.]